MEASGIDTEFHCIDIVEVKYLLFPIENEKKKWMEEFLT